MACSFPPSFPPLPVLTKSSHHFTSLPQLDTTFQYQIPAVLCPENYSPYTHSTQKAPLQSWSPSEPTWINSPRRSHFGGCPSHEPWRSPIPPTPPAATPPVKFKENRGKRQQPPQKRSPSHSFSSISMPAPVELPRRHSQPTLGWISARPNTVGSKPQLHISPNCNRPHSTRSPSPSSSLSSSPIMSPKPRPNVLSTVHPSYQGLQRTETGLIPVPLDHLFKRGEIVMTRTTRRLMKTSSNGRLTARHPCLILESSRTHIRVLQMTSHVDLTEEQCRIVGSRLHYWLAREDPVHRDPYGRSGLVTSPPTDRAGYIWVGDGGEYVPVQQVKYLTGTIVEEPEISRLESLIERHLCEAPTPRTPRLSPPHAMRDNLMTRPAVSL